MQPNAPPWEGGRERLVELYRAERVPMVRLARLLTGSASAAEDLVQDAFVRLYPVLGSVDNPGAYLRRTVVNLCTSHHRRGSVERRWLARQRPPDADPSADLELPPELDETWRAVARLPERQRHVLVLRFYLDLRVEDVADALAMPVGTAKSTLHRALAALSKEIGR
jgi:RNA polymerase sigma-70 factor (sigma-E family)